jgi:hypothetical protein
MASRLKGIYQRVLPARVRTFLGVLRPGTEARLRHEILSYHRHQQGNTQFSAALAYIRKSGLAFFPSSFTRDYDRTDFEVSRDTESGLSYAVHRGRRLYFPVDMEPEMARDYYRQLLVEQDPRSPHCYATADFSPVEGDVIADVGAAEGIFCLENIEVAAHCYLFEPERKWIGALERTFQPWVKKVTIVTRYVSDHPGPETLTLDSYLRDVRVNFLKIDAEGDEIRVLRGAQDSLRQRLDRVVVCSYHHQQDEDALCSLLATAGYVVRPSDGWMLFLQDPNQKPPYFRRGLLRAEKPSS